MSTKMAWVFPVVSTPRNVRRVVWGLWVVAAIFCPKSAFSSDDLPTLGRPTKATVPQRVGASSSRT